MRFVHPFIGGWHGIRYEKIAGEQYSIALFNEAELEAYLDQAYHVQHGEVDGHTQTPYDYIEYDSDIEHKTAHALDGAENVKFFCKLSRWLKIHTIKHVVILIIKWLFQQERWFRLTKHSHIPDLRTYAFHQKAAEILRASPDRLSEVNDVLRHWRTLSGTQAEGWAEVWQGLIKDLSAEEIAGFICKEGEEMDFYRKSSPFACLLSDEQRLEIIRRFSDDHN